MPPGTIGKPGSRDAIAAAPVHILYRMYDGSDTLLYVGITMNPPGRFSMHRIEKPWWHSVNTIKLEHFASREQALEAERQAITQERPECNLVHRPRPVPVLDQMTVRTPAELRAQAKAIAMVRNDRDDHGGGLGVIVREGLTAYVAEFEHLL